MPFRNDGEGLHRSVDPADGRHYVYGMCFMDAAPTIFACFDQPDLKAPYTVHVRAPHDWTVIGNAPGQQVERGEWEFEQSQPLSTYFVTLVAGPYHVLRDEHDGIPLGLSARASIAADLDKDADELFTLTRQCFDELHRLFGIRYPFGDYHQAFVPEFNAGAMENPGCVTFRDPLVFTSRVTRGVRIARASTLAHEMAHQWFGNLVTPAWWDDLWLNESFAEYLGTRVTADVTEYADVWVDNSYARRQWGLVADQRPSTHPVAGNGAVDASAALQDFDGISYAKGCAILRQLNATLGDEVFFSGTIDHFERHRFGNATMHDLFASWETRRRRRPVARSPTTGCAPPARTGSSSTGRPAWSVVRRPPTTPPTGRTGSGRPSRPTTARGPTSVLEVDSPETPFDAGDRPVLLDPYLDTWALMVPDKLTMDALEQLLPRMEDPLLRAGVWSNVRSALHNAAVDPVDVLELVVASLPVEDTEDSRRRTMSWVYGWVLPLQPDRAGRGGRAARRRRGRSWTPPPRRPRSSSRRSASRSRPRPTPGRSRAGCDGTGLPDGVPLDLDLRWRVLIRLADARRGRPGRARPCSSRPSPPAVARVHHARAHASLPTAEAKAWAWSCFTGETDLPNYELEAAGLGLWRGGQEELTEPYVERYFADLPDTVQVRSGWVLAEAAEHFFPRTSLTRETLARARGADRRRRPRPVHPPPARRRGRHPGAQARRARGVPGEPQHEGPPARSHGADPGARARGRGRAPPRGPAGHRGTAGDPARLARRPAAAGLGDHAHPGPRLRAGRGLAGARGAGHRAAAHDRLLHRRRPDARSRSSTSSP